jgi:hypothetical protein
MADISLTSSAYQETEICRAVSYFFNSQSVFPKNVLSGGMKIRTYTNAGPNGASGAFNPDTRDIFIYNTGSSDGPVIGTTLHEIGHYIDCYNSKTRMLASPLALSEAFSGYTGWYLAHEYYKTHGKFVSPSEDITNNGIYGNARQDWSSTSSNIYTPLFVDLTDNYNQRTTSYPNRPNDNIANVPPSVIWSIITTCQTWTQFKSKFVSYAGTGTGKYYTLTQCNEWIAAFINSSVFY